MQKRKKKWESVPRRRQNLASIEMARIPNVDKQGDVYNGTGHRKFSSTKREKGRAIRRAVSEGDVLPDWVC